MRILPSHVIPIFLNQGTLTGQIAAQLLSFDVYYTNPPVVGFHVLSCSDPQGVVGFTVDVDDAPEGAIGFTVSCEDKPEGVVGFTVEESE